MKLTSNLYLDKVRRRLLIKFICQSYKIFTELVFARNVVDMVIQKPNQNLWWQYTPGPFWFTFYPCGVPLTSQGRHYQHHKQHVGRYIVQW